MLNTVEMSLKVSGGSWQTLTGNVPQVDCIRKEGLPVRACVALYLHIFRFKPSDTDWKVVRGKLQQER